MTKQHYSGRVTRERVHGCGCSFCRDRWQVMRETWNLTRDAWHLTRDIWQATTDRWHLKIIYISCGYYLHTSKDSVSPICRIQWWAQISIYSNKIALEYYLYLYLGHFPILNMFGFSFEDFWTAEYILIFVYSWKYKYFQIFSLNLILIFACLCLMNNDNLGLIYASNKHLV